MQKNAEEARCLWVEMWLADYAGQSAISLTPRAQMHRAIAKSVGTAWQRAKKQNYLSKNNRFDAVVFFEAGANFERSKNNQNLGKTDC